MVTKETLVEDIVAIPGMISYFIQHGVSPITCSGAYPQTLGRLLEIKKVHDPDAFIDGVNAFLKRGRGGTMAITPLYTAYATASGGRNGHTQSDDGLVSVDLSIPNAMGGPGKPGTTTPEDLFAAGYAACFGSACEFIAHQLLLSPQSIQVKAAVGIGRVPSGGYGLVVHLAVEVAGVSQADAEQLVAGAHEVCPYSNAIRGNVEVGITATAA